MALRFFLSALLLLACSRQAPVIPEAGDPLTRGGAATLYVSVVGAGASGVRKVDLTAGTISQNVLPGGIDLQLRFDPYGKELAVIGRYGVDRLTFASPDLSGFRKEVALAPASNPQDIAFLNAHLAYVSYLGLEHLDLLNREGVKQAEVDLSRWSDSSGSPEATYLQWVDGKLLVTLQRLNRSFKAEDKSYALLVDPASHSIVAETELIYTNPSTESSILSDAIYIGEAGVVGMGEPVPDGGIEQLNPVSLESRGIVITEAVLGGDLLDFVIVSPSLGFAIVQNGATHLVRFNPTRGELEGSLVQGVGYQFADLLWDENRRLLFVADRSDAAPAVRVFNASGEERVRSRIALDIPPMRLELGE